ncbi:unnamed protein product, partial [Ixodes pacificus]
MLDGNPEIPSLGSGTSVRHFAQRSLLVSAFITLFWRQRKQKACWQGSILGLCSLSRQMGHWTISLRLSVPLELRMVMDWRGVSALFPLPMTSGTACRIPVCPLVATEFEGECALRLGLEYEIAGEELGVWW